MCWIYVGLTYVHRFSKHYFIALESIADVIFVVFKDVLIS